MKSIRDLFSTHRSIDRKIEKVIDYYADDEDRLSAEIEEYEATGNVEACFRKFLDNYQAGVQAGQVTEVGIWVSGFYGSGKSSFTKYLGFALDPDRQVKGQSFLELLANRIHAQAIRAQLLTTARRHPTAVVMLDMGTEQLVESTSRSVTEVLYWKVLQQAGYSKEKKLAQLEFKLNEHGLYDDFKAAFQEQNNVPWKQIHNDPMSGVARASRLLPAFLPEDFPDPASFLKLRFEMTETVRDLAQRMIDIVRAHTRRENILFLIDEAGQYVAPRQESILDMDGLARSFKELGQGRVWMVATGQQTLAEIVEQAAHNSTELNKLRDRFPISVELDARDIREITYRRLLTKSDGGEAELRTQFGSKGQAMILHTRLEGTSFYKDDPGIEDFVRFYPFLPQHFEVLMELIRVLARSTGGIGLRSAIRVIQDVLVDTSRILAPSDPKLADREIGTLATVDDFYKTLRVDINKLLPHVVAGVDKVERIYEDSPLYIRVAQAVAALQPLETFPRTAENIAALLYPALGAPSLIDEVRQALVDLTHNKELGLIEDPQAGGYLFLSESVGPLRKKRTGYVPAGGELSRVRNEILRDILQPQPATRLENIKKVSAGVRMRRVWLVGDREEIRFDLEMVSEANWDARRTALLAETAQRSEYQNAIVWLFKQDNVAEDVLPQIVKSEHIANQINEHTAERDVAQYARAEQKQAERNRERVEGRLREALTGGTFIFRGRPTPVGQGGNTLEAAARTMLGKVAKEVFPQYHLVKIRPETRLAYKFLNVERLDRMPPDRDPLRLVSRSGGAPRVQASHAALAETLRAFKAKANAGGGGRLTGKAVQDFFAAPPYGWTKDAVRYLFAALLVAGEVEFHTGGEVLKTSGPAAREAVKSTVAFGKVGVGLRDSKVSMEALDRGARRLQDLFGEQVLPLEDHISRAVRTYMPDVVEKVGALPDRLRLLGLPGEDRAQDLIDEMTALLRGDASEAPSLLGTPGNAIKDEIEWARSATSALDDHGEADVRQARDLLRGLDELNALYPGERKRIVEPAESDRLQEILGSVRFHEQLPDLRGAVRAVHRRVGERYEQNLHAYRQALQTALTTLENRGNWAILDPDDREGIAARLNLTLPEAPNPRTPLADYRTLTVRRRSLPALVADLEAEITRRQPVIEPDFDDEPEAGGVQPEVQVFPLSNIHPRKVITSQADLDAWLEFLRATIQELLDAGRQVEFDD